MAMQRENGVTVISAGGSIGGGQRTVFHNSLWRKRGCTGLQWLRARGRSEGLKVCGKELEHHLYGKARGTHAL